MLQEHNHESEDSRSRFMIVKMKCSCRSTPAVLSAYFPVKTGGSKNNQGIKSAR